MEHKGTRVLETQRLVLRPFVMKDAQAMFDNWASDSEVTKYLTWPTHPSVLTTRLVLKDWVKRYEKADFYQWAIILKDHGDEPIGSISVVEVQDPVGMAHVGYCIGRSWWHQGITSEAFRAVIRFLFLEVGCLRVEARHDPRNVYSGAVMRKCGLRYEGTLRQVDRNNQGICDVSFYGLLRDEWVDNPDTAVYNTQKNG